MVDDHPKNSCSIEQLDSQWAMEDGAVTQHFFETEGFASNLPPRKPNESSRSAFVTCRHGGTGC
ncbi:MAG: hypothetical protein EOS27_25280 [Mesorhizobium sp.]|nr:MAG: hypothetical protein EOS27_25280 [Mesorhizobium sp.]